MAKKRRSTKYKYEHWNLIRVFIILGALLGIVLAIYYMVYPAMGHDFFNVPIPALVWFVLWGIFHIIFCVMILASTGVVDTKKKLHIMCDWYILILLGLVITLPTGNWGGIIILIGGVIGLFDRL